jgi:hypothetical protein
MAVKIHSDTQEKLEQLIYSPGLPDSGDLEAATRTITATAKPATADYSTVLTLSLPEVTWLQIQRVCARLQVTRDSGTSANLYCTVSVDSADGSANILFDGVDVQASALQVAELTDGDVFDRLTDGNAHTFYFFFWVDSGNAVISLVRLWMGIGTASTSRKIVLKIVHDGQLSLVVSAPNVGTGGCACFILPQDTDWPLDFAEISGSGVVRLPGVLSQGYLSIRLSGTVATDLNYVKHMAVIRRTEQ